MLCEGRTGYRYRCRTAEPHPHTRLAGNKADIWWLRQHPKVMALPFKEGIRRADRDNTIDVYISEDEHDDVLRDGAWQQFFTEQPEVLTLAEKKEWIAKNTKVALGSGLLPLR